MKFSLFAIVFTLGTNTLEASNTIPHEPNQTVPPHYDTCLIINNEKRQHYFLSELAMTPQQKQTGMMFREDMNDNNAMLFVFQKPQKLSFWMKNVRFPLDMLFFNQHGVLQEIKHNVPPCTSTPCSTYPAKDKDNVMVLELKGGTAYERKISVGATISVSHKENNNCYD